MSSLTARLASALTLACATFATGARAADLVAADPCDFASSGQSVFPYAQVMQCFEQIPFSRTDLHEITEVVAQARSFSDLSELYDARVHWRRALAALDEPGVSFPNDLAMHMALLAEHKRFRNLHVSYWPPGCYWRMLTAFLPLDFGSTLRQVGRHTEQILFVESPLQAEAYQQATGIDVQALVGQRVLSVNGVPALDYFRRYVEQIKTHEDAGGGLNGVLSGSEYSVRFAAQRAFVPDRPAEEFVFEAIDGTRRSVELPWLFGLSSLFLGTRAYAPTASSEEFVALCQEGPPPLQGFLSDAGPTAAPFSPAGLRAQPAEPELMPELRRRRRAPSAASSYFEVPAERLGQDIVEVIPASGSARVVQYHGDVTALQLRNTNGWVDVARRGVEYACENSTRLILDLRSNSGGADTVIRWLHHYLFPADGTLVAAGMLALRLRNDSAAFDEILRNNALYAASVLPQIDPDAGACELLFTPGCFVDPRSNTPLGRESFDWFLSPRVHEWRGGRLVSLSRQFALPDMDAPVFDEASCAGRFAGDDLVLITNGSNSSGGYFLPAAFKGDGVIVSTGGFVGEPMAMGRARGGATQRGSQWAETAHAIATDSAGQIRYEQPILAFRRPVDSMMEMLGAYREDGRTLHLEAPVEADLHVDVWTTLPGSEGFVYERVLQAVDESAGER
jgi:hypothetical protein